ncbi:M1 family aminopeptidase [Edaphobacter sp.]|uniref:M1 family aminopeptidase n=1 Tax=Edaphobacter sp. TaxID=1934404 RepID=UPI002DBF99B7|nr:M1 family aminopeptidase [Edaphobacter sp.]HEU5341326.1 M1 family aminopeptidase [Edaphobacter sp.]
MRCLFCVLLFAIASGLPAQEPQPQQGTVLFSRDQASAAAKTAAPAEKEPAVAVTDVERNSLTFTAYDLDAHLTPAQAGLAVHARLTVRNSGARPLTRLVFQVSSSLHWQSFGLEASSGISQLSFIEHTIDTDLDHTGKASEAVVALAEPLAPGASLSLSAFYAGDVKQSANRLERIGAPDDKAALADWDRISPELTALRGFGDVLWYPVASAPVFLGDGAKLFQTVGKSRLAQAGATVRLRLAVAYVGDPPDAAYFCGRREQLTVVSENKNLPVVDSPGIATAEFAARALGFRPLSLFVTDRPATVTDDTLIGAVTDHYDALPNYAAAAAKVAPLLKDWLGAEPLTMLNIIDQAGQPFEDDALLVAPVRAATPGALAPALVHSLGHIWFRSSQQWLDEGVPEFMALLWLEQTQGRDAAIAQLQSKANALALAEPVVKDDSTAVGQSLVDATSEVYYRTKAAAVLWMLRSIVGDAALKQALQTYRRAGKDDEDPEAFERVLEASAHRDLRWFFNDWVYRDRGLPDLVIADVTPRLLQTAAKGTSWLVSVDVRNNGYAAAEVPVTVRSGDLTMTQRLRIAGQSDASTRILFPSTPQEVIVNDGSVPEVTASSHTKQIVAR